MRDLDGYLKRAFDIDKLRRRLSREFTDRVYIRKFRPDELKHDPQIFPWIVTATRGAERGFRFGTQAKAMNWVWREIEHARKSSTR